MIEGRRTVAGSASLTGVGLHHGRACTLTFRPGPPGSGIVFRRVMGSDHVDTPARVESAVLAERRTQLGEGDGALHTVEHVLAAVAGLEIDDLLIEMSGAEPPIMDGSAAPFVAALREAGLAVADGAPEYLEVDGPVRIEDGSSWYEAHPSETLELDVRIDFPHPLIGAQRGVYQVTPASFERELASARTFGFVHEVDALRQKGLIQGASTANAVVLDATGVVETVLRWPDEFVRHKAMDCVGDLALAGARVRARIIAHKPSHRGTVLLVRAMTQAVSRRN